MVESHTLLKSIKSESPRGGPAPAIAPVKATTAEDAHHRERGCQAPLPNGIKQTPIAPSRRWPKHPNHNRNRRNAASKGGQRPHVKAATPALADAPKCHRETKADATRHRYPTAQSRLDVTQQSSSRSRGEAVCTTAGLAPSVPSKVRTRAMPMLAMTDARTYPFGKVSARIDIIPQMTTGGTANARLR